MTNAITPCLWFDTNAEEAVHYYLSIFKNSKITAIARQPDLGREFHGKKGGEVLTIAFELDGRAFTALNGGPYFKFTEAISLQIECATQEEVDYYWEKLSAGGDPEAQECGWLKDKYGLSWQVVPKILPELLTSPDPDRAKRAFEALIQMKKLEIVALERAADGV
jgi:predicted 3-demethylubiquinone-9 3-methyltransferase (glyoxalase superfamily)